DADRQRQQGRCRKPRILAQQPEAEACVLQQSIDGTPAPHLARDFLDRSDVAELAAYSGRGLVGAFTALDAIARSHLEMTADLLMEVVVSPATPEWESHLHLYSERSAIIGSIRS